MSKAVAPKQAKTVQIYTMCMVYDEQNDRVLLVKRPNAKGFPGYIAPGGKVDFPESIVDGAIREVYEETGIQVEALQYKGLAGFSEVGEQLRYMVFNYLATSFSGELLANPPEGELLWVPRHEALSLPMQPWFKERFPLFFAEGTFEYHSIWDKQQDHVLQEDKHHYE